MWQHVMSWKILSIEKEEHECSFHNNKKIIEFIGYSNFAMFVFYQE
jgi:hypothetical protein